MTDIYQLFQQIMLQMQEEWQRSTIRAKIWTNMLNAFLAQLKITQKWPWALFISAICIFTLYPETDLWFSAFFYHSEQGFYLHDVWLVKLIYAIFRDLPFIWVPMLFWLWAASWLWAKKSEKHTRRILLFLIVSLALGPGLFVNSILKGESGRARPHQIEQFGGDKAYSEPFKIADQCQSNCSFVSGHASMGFYFIAIAWVLGNRRWLYYGVAIGAIVGFGRILQGGHFLSDVIFAYVAVYFTALLCARWLLGKWLPDKAS